MAHNDQNLEYSELKPRTHTAIISTQSMDALITS